MAVAMRGAKSQYNIFCNTLRSEQPHKPLGKIISECQSTWGGYKTLKQGEVAFKDMAGNLATDMTSTAHSTTYGGTRNSIFCHLSRHTINDNQFNYFRTDS